MTSRETQRVVIPKGWPMKNRKDWTSAKIEARQEAGVIGEIGRKPIGHYRYWKRLEGYFALVKVADGSGRYAACENDGRTRYIHTREASAFLTVNGVPLSSSG